MDAGPQVSSRRAPQPSRHCRIADAGTGKSTLIRRLDEVDRWETILSGGELQRIGFARLLVMQPDIAILDEAAAPNWPSFTIAS